MTHPMAPLWRWLELRHRPLNERLDHRLAMFGAADAAEALGVTPHTIHRWRHHGLSDAVADRLATSLGTHPALIWGDAWWAGAEEVAS